MRWIAAILATLWLVLPTQKKAEKYAAEHREGWYELWRSLDVSPEMAEAVVFPELLRYSAVQDGVERVMNYTTYVEFGTLGFNFSVGRFQIKPSFVEKLEKAWMSSSLPRQYRIWFDTGSTESARRARIGRMQEEEWQCLYVGMFLKLFYLTFGSVDRWGNPTQKGLETLSEQDQLRLVATAFNRGCEWPAPGRGNWKALLEHADEKHFYLGGFLEWGAEHYCYADLSLEWYYSITGRMDRPLKR